MRIENVASVQITDVEGREGESSIFIALPPEGRGTMGVFRTFHGIVSPESGVLVEPYTPGEVEGQQEINLELWMLGLCLRGLWMQHGGEASPRFSLEMVVSMEEKNHAELLDPTLTRLAESGNAVVSSISGADSALFRGTVQFLDSNEPQSVEAAYSPGRKFHVRVPEQLEKSEGLVWNSVYVFSQFLMGKGRP